MLYRDEAKRINLYLNQRCNRDCTYCVIHDNDIEYEFFDYDSWRILLNDFSDDEIVVHIYGGEPLIHPDIKNIVKFFRQNNCQVLLLTNGDLIENFKDLDVEFIVTYHPSNIQINDFIRNIQTAKDKIVSISCMHENDLEKSISDFKYLKQLFECEVVFWPIINPHSNKKGHSPSLNIPFKIEQEFIEQDQNFFRLNKDGVSTFHVWRDLGLFIPRNDDTKKYFNKPLDKCTFMGRDLIEVYNNHIFRCSADLQVNIGPTNYKEAYHITQYKEFIKSLNDTCFKCTAKTCISFDYDYMIGNLK